jgi:copper oxidase (laccase) domain-containing protein
MTLETQLVHEEVEGIGVLADPAARERGLLVAFTDRRGGVSKPPYAELNLAARVGDDLDDVTENRHRAAKAVGYDEGRLALSRQVHGKELLNVPAP